MKKILEIINMAVVVVGLISLSQAADDAKVEDDAKTQVAYMPIKELDAKIALALQIRLSSDKVKALVDLVKYSYPMKFGDTASDEYVYVGEFVPALTVLLSNKINHDEASEIIIAALPDITDSFYRRRLIHILEKNENRQIDVVIKGKISDDKMNVYLEDSAKKEYGDYPPVDYFIPAVLSKEVIAVIEAKKRAMEKQKNE
jgi:hypothetical protein